MVSKFPYATWEAGLTADLSPVVDATSASTKENANDAVW
jgi:hypothetical protein